MPDYSVQTTKWNVENKDWLTEDSNKMFYTTDDKKDLEDRIKQLYIDMEQEAEPEGGEVADRYGSELNKLEDKLYRVMKQINDYDMNESTRQDLGMNSSISKSRAKAALKNPSNDGSKVYGLDKDGKRVHIKSINDIDKFNKFEIDADLNESLNESLNPEVSRSLDKFIRAMADRYDYTMQDAVYAIMAALKQRNYDGVNEVELTQDFGELDEDHTNAENRQLKKIEKELKGASKMHKRQAKQIKKIVSEEDVKALKEKLCKKGEAYRKRRMAAGEKSSAYLSGRAVKVCKGQMSGKKKKK